MAAGVPHRARRAVVGDALVLGVHGSSRALRMGCVEHLPLALGADGVDVGLGLLVSALDVDLRFAHKCLLAVVV